jgi:hypothetical protein
VLALSVLLAPRETQARLVPKAMWVRPDHLDLRVSQARLALLGRKARPGPRRLPSIHHPVRHRGLTKNVNGIPPRDASETCLDLVH